MGPAPILVGVGAGAASALLYAAAASGSPLALVLLYVAPLPILLAGVGWRHYAGLVATVFGAVVLSAAIGPRTGLIYAAAVGLPSWWLAYLTLLARPGESADKTEWYPVGRLVIWCSVLGAALVAASIPLVATSLDEYRASLKEVFSRAFESREGAPAPELPGGQDPKALIDLMVVVAPIMAAAFWSMSSLFNLWLAGRITRASKRLARPWPDLRAVALPPNAPFALAGGLGGSLLPGLAGMIAELFAATFLLAFALLGLAVMHVVARATPARGLVLFTVYALLVLQPWVMLPLATLGLAEQFLGIRRRFRPPGPPPPPTAQAGLP